MNTLRRLRNFWIPWVTTIALACSSAAVAQTRYKVTDLGREEGEEAACAMSVNDEGWTEIMAWNGAPGNNINSIFPAASGRALIDADGFKLDLNLSAERGKGMTSIGRSALRHRYELISFELGQIYGHRCHPAPQASIA